MDPVKPFHMCSYQSKILFDGKSQWNNIKTELLSNIDEYNCIIVSAVLTVKLNIMVKIPDFYSFLTA